MNPVKTELRKPYHIVRINDGLRRLVDDFRTSEFSDSLSYQLSDDVVADPNAPPLFVFGATNTGGNQIILNFNKNVLGVDSTVSIVINSVTFSLTYNSGSGTNVLVYDYSDGVHIGDILSVIFDSSGITDDSFNALADGTPDITNNSTVKPFGNNPGDTIAMIIATFGTLAPISGTNSFAYQTTNSITVEDNTVTTGINGADALSLSFWFFSDSLDDGLLGYGLMRFGNDASSIGIGVSATGDLLWGMPSDQRTYSPGNSSLLTNWHHIVLTCKLSTHVFNLYVDNVHVVTNYTSLVTPTFGDIIFGQDIDSVGYNNYSGRQDDIRLYGSVLTTQNVADLFNNADVTGLNGNLLLYYSFESEFDDSLKVADHSP